MIARLRTYCCTAAILACWVTVSSCSPRNRQAERSTSRINRPVASKGWQAATLAQAGAGVQCVPYGKSTSEGPRSYLVSDLGKTGVPELSGSELNTLRLIQRYVHSRLLRFAFVGQFGGEFIIFNAKLGPCLDAAGGYRVLNGAFCNAFYEPGEDPWGTKAEAGGFSACGPRRPWVSGDPGPNIPSYWSNP